ncbi:MAG: cytochrome c5 family protein [Gammaproteobacteria bacterium]|nr:MAG: cytochrome c5 family protein [Pseudomonadota bacterium]PIE38160.1 MAG: cytochrome c5 family protein [Gammaproteobacteria bacterium]
MKQILRLVALVTVLTAPVTLAPVASASVDVEAIKERIKPVGEVCVEGDPCADASAAPVAAAATSGGPRTGEEIYKAKCSACHMVGVAGAPVFGKADQWAPRIEKGMDALLANAISGINAMPPRGTCSDCTDEELEGVVTYMVNSSK